MVITWQDMISYASEVISLSYDFTVSTINQSYFDMKVAWRKMHWAFGMIKELALGHWGIGALEALGTLGLGL